jgi:thimet oligopeptidase
MSRQTAPALALTGVLALLCILVLAAGCLQDATLGSTPAPVPTATPAIEAHMVQGQYSPGEIAGSCAEAEREANASLNAIAAIPKEERTFDSTMGAFDRVLSDYSDRTFPLITIGSIYPDPAIASEGLSCRESSSTFLSTVYTRRDLYDAMKGQDPLTPDGSRLYTITIHEFERNGLSLPDEQLAEVRALRANLTSVEVRFMKNLNNDNTRLEFTADELAGLSADNLATLEPTPRGTYIVTMSGPDYSLIMTKADRNETRRKMYMADLNRQAEENTALLEEAILLRRQIARELGYGSWADYRLDDRMAKNTSTVMSFLESMKAPLQEKTRLEREELLTIKKGLDPNATSLDPWDISYLLEKQKQMLYSYNDDEVREYFPVDRVLSGVFSVYGDLFGLRFDPVEGAEVWSPEVMVYRVGDSRDNTTIGYLYLDLYPRNGKGQGYYETGLSAGRLKNGTYAAPSVLIVGNAHEPEGDKPALMDMYEVETIFHETGHAMHEMLTRAPYGSLSGTRVAWDFVETPSQTMEEWTWDPQVLDSLSGHYTNSSEKIPTDLRDRVIASRMQGAGIRYSSLLLNSLEDMRFHTAEGPVNVTEIYYTTYEDVRGYPAVPGIYQPAQFDHLVGGYDAGYYGYLWSKVYALEILDEFQHEGMTNRSTGMKFRTAILEKGNLEDGNVLLHDFLGREPGTGALYNYIGITVTPAIPA